MQFLLHFICESLTLSFLKTYFVGCKTVSGNKLMTIFSPSLPLEMPSSKSILHLLLTNAVADQFSIMGECGKVTKSCPQFSVIELTIYFPLIFLLAGYSTSGSKYNCFLKHSPVFFNFGTPLCKLRFENEISEKISAIVFQTWCLFLSKTEIEWCKISR